MAGATARRARLDHAKADNISAVGTDFTDASFEGADLLDADLRHAKLTGAATASRLIGASLVGATGVTWPLPATGLQVTGSAGRPSYSHPLLSAPHSIRSPARMPTRSQLTGPPGLERPKSNVAPAIAGGSVTTPWSGP